MTWIAARGTIVLIVAFSVRPAFGGPTCSMRQFDWVASNVSSGRVGLLTDFEGRRFAGVFSIFENPYSIAGLTSSHLLAGCGDGSRSLWLDWSHLGHELYREDRFSAFLGFGCARLGLRCVAVPAFESRGARGFAAIDSRSLHLSASYERRGAVRVALGASVYESDPAAPRAAVASVETRSSSFSVAVVRFLSGCLEGDTRSAVEARLDRECSLLLEYRSKTNEISSGLAVVARSLVVCICWAQNPALGSTVSIEVGRVWLW